MPLHSSEGCGLPVAEFRLTPAAERDLEAIWFYTARQWSLEKADRYIDALTAAFINLSEAPKTAPSCNHIRSGYRRWGVERHMIYFRETGSGIVIVRVLHERMDSSSHL